MGVLVGNGVDEGTSVLVGIGGKVLVGILSCVSVGSGSEVGASCVSSM